LEKMAYVLECVESHWKKVEIPVGKDGISSGMRGIPLENLEMPVGKNGISSGKDGIPLEKGGNASWKIWHKFWKR